MVIANVNIGVLFVFAVASLGVYGIVLAGWSSNSKYPFLGGVRSTSQMISYELSLGLSVVPIFLVMGELNLPKIVEYQIQNGWSILPLTNLHTFVPGLFGGTTPDGGASIGDAAAVDPDADLVFRLHGIHLRRDEPPSLRSARGRDRTRRGLPHGIFLDEVRPVFPGRIRGHDHWLLADRDALPGRLARPVHPGWQQRTSSACSGVW